MTSRRLGSAQALAVTRERLLWNHRAQSWDAAGSTGLTAVVEAVLEACDGSAETVAVDLGCGTGQVSVPLARRCARVLAVDVSALSVERLRHKALEAGIDAKLQLVVHPIETLDLPPGSVDLIVSNYALHHLRDADKAELVRRAYQWLRPGGQLVIGDMMFGRGGSAQDRAILVGKARAFARRGPAGWWRLAKNLWRFAFRVWEKPLPVNRWEYLVGAAGFTGVTVTHVIAEAHILSARRPAAG